MGHVPELNPLQHWSHMLALASQQLPSQSTPPHDTTVPKKPAAVHPTSSPKACSQSGARQYFQQQPSVSKHLSRVWSPTRMQTPGLGDFATTKWVMQMSHSKDQMSQAWCGSCPIPPGARLHPHHYAAPAPGQPWRPWLLTHSSAAPIISLKQKISPSFLRKMPNNSP